MRYFSGQICEKINSGWDFAPKPQWTHLTGFREKASEK